MPRDGLSWTWDSKLNARSLRKYHRQTWGFLSCSSQTGTIFSKALITLYIWFFAVCQSYTLNHLLDLNFPTLVHHHGWRVRDWYWHRCTVRLRGMWSLVMSAQQAEYILKAERRQPLKTYQDKANPEWSWFYSSVGNSTQCIALVFLLSPSGAHSFKKRRWSGLVFHPGICSDFMDHYRATDSFKIPVLKQSWSSRLWTACDCSC